MFPPQKWHDTSQSAILLFCFSLGMVWREGMRAGASVCSFWYGIHSFGKIPHHNCLWTCVCHVYALSIHIIFIRPACVYCICMNKNAYEEIAYKQPNRTLTLGTILNTPPKLYGYYIIHGGNCNPSIQLCQSVSHCMFSLWRVGLLMHFNQQSWRV